MSAFNLTFGKKALFAVIPQICGMVVKQCSMRGLVASRPPIWGHWGGGAFWTKGVICTNIEPVVQLKEVCHVRRYYCTFSPPWTARNP